jgi:hypothetical protein
MGDNYFIDSIFFSSLCYSFRRLLMGICKCGCGGYTPVIRGVSRKYIRGHKINCLTPRETTSEGMISDIFARMNAKEGISDDDVITGKDLDDIEDELDEYKPTRITRSDLIKISIELPVEYLREATIQYCQDVLMKHFFNLKTIKTLLEPVKEKDGTEIGEIVHYVEKK